MMPVQASTIAGSVDRIFFLVLGIALVIMLIVGVLVASFAIRYRRGSRASRGPLPSWLTRDFEISWTVGTLFLGVFLFWFAAAAEIPQLQPPKDALEIHVVAKQWMWKIQHPNGVREIDTLHVPQHVPVKLVMTSQDVIHSFFVPAFRIKQDVLPGRYTQIWFNADKLGTFHLFCAEYCGTDHARMTGGIVVQRPEDYARWSAAQPQGDDLAAEGAKLFVALGCAGCHGASSRVRAPALEGIYGKPQPLAGGGFAVADESYLRDSILQPHRQIVAGYDPVMPSYQDVVSEEQIVPLIAYLKVMPSGRSAAR